MGMNSAVVRMAAFAAFAVVVSAAEAAEAKRSFGTVPKQALVELKATVGKPFSSGLVFIDGKFIPPPYKVERFGTAFRINGQQVTRQVIPWDEFLKTQPGVRIEQIEIAPSAPAESAAPETAAAEAAEPADDDSDISDDFDDLFDDNPKPKKKQLHRLFFDHTAKIWNVADGKCDTTFSGHEMEVVALQFDPTSSQLLTGSMDGSAKIWNIETGLEIFEMKHEGEVISCSFNTDGDKILTGSFDHTAKIWDSYNGNLIFDLKEHTEEISSCQFNFSGTQVVTASVDKTVKAAGLFDYTCRYSCSYYGKLYCCCWTRSCNA